MILSRWYSRREMPAITFLNVDFFSTPARVATISVNKRGVYYVKAKFPTASAWMVVVGDEVCRRKGITKAPLPNIVPIVL